MPRNFKPWMPVKAEVGIDTGKLLEGTSLEFIMTETDLFHSNN